jgi:hypothetical protein
MIRRHKSNLILFLSLQAIAVAIICFGSLINFHQYKIWGKPLIPNFVGYKRDIEKYSKTISYSKYTQGNQHLQNVHQWSDFDFPVETLRAQYGSGSFISYDFSQKEPITHRVYSSGLRGPPIS